MKEYIDKAEAVERALYAPIMSNGPVEEKDIDAWVAGSDTTQEQIAKAIGKISAADVVERKRGEWGKVYRSKVTVNDGYVSTCCDMWNERKSNFCPNCGADMREVDHETD